MLQCFKSPVSPAKGQSGQNRNNELKEWQKESKVRPGLRCRRRLAMRYAVCSAHARWLWQWRVARGTMKSERPRKLHEYIQVHTNMRTYIWTFGHIPADLYMYILVHMHTYIYAATKGEKFAVIQQKYQKLKNWLENKRKCSQNIQERKSTTKLCQRFWLRQSFI